MQTETAAVRDFQDYFELVERMYNDLYREWDNIPQHSRRREKEVLEAQMIALNNMIDNERDEYTQIIMAEKYEDLQDKIDKL